MPLSCLDEPWCSWPENSPENRAALAQNPYFALLVARMVWCQKNASDLALSYPHRHIVYLLYLYMDMHVPWIIAADASGGRLPAQSRDFWPTEKSEACVLRHRSLLPEHVEPVCEEGLPKNLIQSHGGDRGSAADAVLKKLIWQAFPRRAISKEMAQNCVRLIAERDFRVRSIFLCGVLGNYTGANVMFRLPLAQRARLLQGPHQLLVQRARAWCPVLSYTIREYVAFSQLRPAATIGISRRSDCERFWYNVLTTMDCAVRPHVARILSLGDTSANRAAAFAHIELWQKHTPHGVSSAQRSEPPIDLLRKLLTRRFSTRPRESHQPRGIAQLVADGELTADTAAVFAPFLDTASICSRDEVQAAVLAIDTDYTQPAALFEAVMHATRENRRQHTLFFDPVPLNVWALNSKKCRETERFCPSCFQLSFAIPGAYQKAAKFKHQFHMGHYTTVCTCGEKTRQIDIRGFIITYKGTRAALCTSCMHVKRIADMRACAGDALYVCSTCAV